MRAYVMNGIGNEPYWFRKVIFFFFFPGMIVVDDDGAVVDGAGWISAPRIFETKDELVVDGSMASGGLEMAGWMECVFL